MMTRNLTDKLLKPDIRGNSCVEVKILCFHRVVLDGKQDSVWTLGVGEFQHQIRRFAESGFHSISLTDLYNWQTASKALPAKPFVITFDDGHEGFSEFAAPVL